MVSKSPTTNDHTYSLGLYITRRTLLIALSRSSLQTRKKQRNREKNHGRKFEILNGKMKTLLLLGVIATADYGDFYDTDYDGHLYAYDQARSKLICSKV